LLTYRALSSAGRRSHRGPSGCHRSSSDDRCAGLRSSSYGSPCSLLVAPSCGRWRSCSLHHPCAIWHLSYPRHLGSLPRGQCMACCGSISSLCFCTSLLLSMCLGHSSAAHGQDTSRCTLLANRRPCSLAPLPSVGFHHPAYACQMDPGFADTGSQSVADTSLGQLRPWP
jgi:hypothetical protein